MTVNRLQFHSTLQNTGPRPVVQRLVFNSQLGGQPPVFIPPQHPPRLNQFSFTTQPGPAPKQVSLTTQPGQAPKQVSFTVNPHNLQDPSSVTFNSTPQDPHAPSSLNFNSTPQEAQPVNDDDDDDGVTDDTLVKTDKGIRRLSVTRRGRELEWNDTELVTQIHRQNPFMDRIIAQARAQNPKWDECTHISYNYSRGMLVGHQGPSDLSPFSYQVDPATYQFLRPFQASIVGEAKPAPLKKRTQEDTTFRRLTNHKDCDSTDVQNGFEFLRRKYPHFEPLIAKNINDADLDKYFLQKLQNRTLDQLRNKLFVLPVQLEDGQQVLIFVDFRTRTIKTVFPSNLQTPPSQILELTHNIQQGLNSKYPPFTVPAGHAMTKMYEGIRQIAVAHKLIESQNDQQFDDFFRNPPTENQLDGLVKILTPHILPVEKDSKPPKTFLQKLQFWK